MKSKIIKILLFLFVGLECLAITNRERIEKDLRKLNITDSTMIAQTINIDEKLGDKLLQGETIEGTLKELKNLVEKNPKNFYISYQVARYYLETEKNIEEVKKNRKYFDLYIENTPHEEESLAMNMLYYEKIGDKEKFKKYYDEFSKKTSGRWMGVLVLARYKKDLVSLKKDVTLALELLKKQIKDGNKDEVTDEELFVVQNMYDSLVVQELLEKKEYQKIVDYYLNNMANQNYYTTGIMIKYGDRIVSQLGFVTNINEKFLNKNKENFDKLTNTKVYRELEKIGKVIIVNN
ncbi:hypothetical protein [Fusobacterium polymorphum]|jgi:hypothetical protein|uniref:Uncharacterized protein n=1 Tax=Fusobacterium nucleatum subsp. polymorphum TaxID=76857 RepID=A0A2C6C764_FUSNP|nr:MULTISPECIES: hypothetical protein [Fusobacterium]MBW9312100.1 hypothetical protein [Fusobacterium nucleatum]PHI12283.1 hypothetical protein CBG56_08560 [Fusobacterium polymorphum]BEO97679.1 hypothetical protein FNCP10_25340 [Fusobacterium nucleatum]BEP09060.1 hypothetical protein FNSP10_24340 [Fusobacterium nucleatum]